MFDDVVPYTIDTYTTPQPANESGDDTPVAKDGADEGAESTQADADTTEESTEASSSQSKDEEADASSSAEQTVQATQDSWVICEKVQLTHQVRKYCIELRPVSSVITTVNFVLA